MIVTDQIFDLINEGALVVCNHSGGKDSQAMYAMLKQLVPADQLIVIHAHLEGVEWEGTLSHIQETTSSELHVVQAGKTFLEMVENRGMFPSPKYRQCTSDLKRAPIEKKIRQILKDRVNKTVINCMGLRAEESSNRAKKETFKLNAANSKNGRTWYEWLPIHEYLIGKVWQTIEMAGQKPHWAYSVGMSRLSCCFCIMASEKDLKIAAKYNPEMLAEIDRLERKFDQTMLMPVKGERRFLTDIVGEPEIVELPF